MDDDIEIIEIGIPNPAPTVVEVSTLVSTKGDQGDQGDKGETGNQGIQGPAGPAGVQGEQGIAGVKGDNGDKGDQGIQGIQGPAGSNAPMQIYCQSIEPIDPGIPFIWIETLPNNKQRMWFSTGA